MRWKNNPMGPRHVASTSRLSALVTLGLVTGSVLVSTHPSYGDPGAITHSDVFLFGTMTSVEGAASQLVRTDEGVTASLQTSSLEPGAVHTLWWVVFNEPESCMLGTLGACGLMDLLNGTGIPSLLWGTGHVVGGNGAGNLGAHLPVGDPRGEVVLGEEQGLLDPWGAEIHVVVRTHGEPIPKQVYEQLNTFMGGCNENSCANLQVSVHE